MLRVKLTTALAIAMVIWPSGAYAFPDGYPVVPASEPSAAGDLRSPDARDAARDVAVAPAERTRVSATRSVPSVSDGFEWSDAGIGAAAMLALLTGAGGTLLLIGRSRRRAPTV
jgi:hypothetical protein